MNSPVTDVVSDRATGVATAHGARAVRDFEALLADPAVDVVIIATPPVAHGPMARAAADGCQRWPRNGRPIPVTRSSWTAHR